MKLRLVREDGTPARIEDLENFSTLDIDGVQTIVSRVEWAAPDGGARRGRFRLELTYELMFERPTVHSCDGFGGFLPVCPFRRKRWLRIMAEREAAVAKDRRRIERTINLWPAEKP